MTATPAAAPAALRPPAPVTRSRVAWVDRLRIWLTVLVVAHHAAYTYASISAWYVPEPGHDASAVALTVFMAVNQGYFMGMFFLLSGLFVPGSADRKGLGRFTRDRLLRLGVPILCYVLVVRTVCLIPAAVYLHNPAYLVYGGDPGVTWFLEVLLLVALGYVLVRLLTRRTSAEASRKPGLPLVVAFVAALAVLGWVWQWITPPGSYWPVVGLPSPNFLPQYLLFFVAGLAASRKGWLQRLPRWYAAPAAVALIVGTGLYASTITGPVDIHHLAAGAVSAVGQALFAVGAAVLLVLAFRTLLARPAGRVTRFLADQSFVVYVIHPAILVGTAVALNPVHAPAVVKAALLFAIAAPLCWGAGWLLRRIRLVRQVA